MGAKLSYLVGWLGDGGKGGGIVLGSPSVTPSHTKQERYIEMEKGCHIFYEGRQLGLFFSIVSFQMCPQAVCPRGCIITLDAFVHLFSAVHFQMCSQITRM